MIRYYRRYLQVLVRFLPIALALLRDRRRFLLAGPSRRGDESVHRARAERLTESMLELGPAFVTVGQVLSTRSSSFERIASTPSQRFPPALGMPILASAFVLASALLTVHEQRYEVVSLVVAALFFVRFLRT